jgi:hypothetical protein
LFARAAAASVFAREPGDTLGNAFDGGDGADALTRTPDVLPCLGIGVAARTEVHLGRIAFRQIVGIETGGHDRRAQVVAVNAGEQVGIDDVGSLLSTMACL